MTTIDSYGRTGAGLLLIFLLGFSGCATTPERLLSPPIGAPLASVAFDRDVLVLGTQVEATGILVDQYEWNRPVDEAAARWSGSLLQGWRQLYPGSLDWLGDAAQTRGYGEITATPVVDSWFGFDRPEGVRYKVPEGWNFISVGDQKKWKALADAWRAEGFWTLRASATYVLEDASAIRQSYHLSVRNVVTLVDAGGAVLGETTVMSYSESRPYVGWNNARRELVSTLPEAAEDFLLKWRKLAQKE